VLLTVLALLGSVLDLLEIKLAKHLVWERIVSIQLSVHLTLCAPFRVIDTNTKIIYLT
jgi:hypothetical protein